MTRPAARRYVSWVREAERGETEGRKPGPVAEGVWIARPNGNDVLALTLARNK